jgi:pimeloyl-ACP methyl ester carboxylesterase
MEHHRALLALLRSSRNRRHSGLAHGLSRPGLVSRSALQARTTRAARASQVPLLAVWGKGDQIFGPDGARAFADDLPGAEIHLLDGGHFLLESALDEVGDLIRGFLGRLEDVR